MAASTSKRRAGSGADLRAGARFLDPKVLSRIGNLDLLARITVDGFISGLHKTRFLGVSTEFAEHRGYSPGDDVRHIDWRVFARTDRLYVKCYEAETNADLVLALDMSKSMDFSSDADALTKFDYARFATASLAHLAHRQRDRVGLATFNEEPVDVVPASARHRDRVLATLGRTRPDGRSDLSNALDRLGATLSRRSIVVVLSDFYDEARRVVTALDGLRVRGHDVIAIHVLDPLERDLAARDARGGGSGDVEVFEDLESGERLPVARELRKDYARLVDDHLATLSRECGARGVQYANFDTAQPLDFLMFEFLSRRARLSRVR